MAPRSPDLGVMLPYTPLHHLLLRDAGRPLVMTSGNVSDEPIAYEDDDAVARLGRIADVVLTHDRPIETRTDDSVLRSVAGRGAPLMLRRSRGYVPAALTLPLEAPPLLACGAELKNTFCLARGRRAWVGHHIGDLRNWETLRSFREGVAHFERLFSVEPAVVAHDLHPDYLSTREALEREGVEALGVQHHHAHLAACLAEHGELGPAVGAIYDGTGYGDDGTVWGGELLVGGPGGFERAGHLHPVRMPGGERAIAEPWRMACAWLVAGAGADAGPPAPPPTLDGQIERRIWDQVAGLASSGVASPETSSMGRLFDAVAALCGVRVRVTYEGQAAAELEGLADPAERGAYPLPLEPPAAGRPAVLDARPTVAALVEDLRAGVTPDVAGARFHNAVADATAAACAQVAGDHGLETAVLAGGVFQNRLLLERTAERLAERRAAGAGARAAAAQRRRHRVRSGRGGGGRALSRARGGRGGPDQRGATTLPPRAGENSSSPRESDAWAGAVPALRGLERGEGVAFGVEEVAQAPDLGDVRRLHHHPAARLWHSVLDLLDRVDLDGAHERVEALAFGGQRRVPLDERAVDAGHAVRAGGQQAVVEGRPLPALHRPAEHPGVEALGPVHVVGLDFEVHHAAHRRSRQSTRTTVPPGRTLVNVIEQLVEQIEGRFAELSEQMADPQVIGDQRRYAEVGRAYRALEPAHRLALEWRRATDDAAGARELLDEDGDDPELRELLRASEARLSELDEEIRLAMVEPDPNDDKDVIVEIRPGTGGEEAGLFAADLHRMLSRYAERRRFKTEAIDVGNGHFTFAIKGQGAYSVFKYEGGTHRVQRVPETESQGRIHTSTATVAVLPEAEEVDVAVDPNDLQVDVYRSSGPGGQSVNTTDSAVRITHKPTGVVVSMQDEKSQLQNREKAMRVLRARLLEREIAARQAEQAAARLAQVGTGERAEKIRTYNFPQDRVTDHRVGLTKNNLPAVLGGELDEFTAALESEEKRRLLEAGELVSG